MANFGPNEMDNYNMSPEELYSIVAYLCTVGEQSDCDTENSTTVIPAAIKTVFGFDVDITFGMEQDDEAANEAEAEDDSEQSETATAEESSG
jgi:hypothetical protein